MGLTQVNGQWNLNLEETLTWYVSDFNVGRGEFLCEQGGYPALPCRGLEHTAHPQLSGGRLGEEIDS